MSWPDVGESLESPPVVNLKAWLRDRTSNLDEVLREMTTTYFSVKRGNKLLRHYHLTSLRTLASFPLDDWMDDPVKWFDEKKCFGFIPAS